MMNIPADLRYSSDHEWIRQDGNAVTIGITAFAQDSLGDVVFVEVPDVGTVVASGESFTEVESKSWSPSPSRSTARTEIAPSALFVMTC